MRKFLLYLVLFALAVLLFSIGYLFLTAQKAKPLQVPLQENSNQQMNNKKTAVVPFFLYPDKTADQVIYHAYYTLAYSEKDEQALWVAYRVYPNSINPLVARSNNFREDEAVLTGSASLEDYKNSGYDRGHLAPAKTLSFNQVSMSESFLMSNMSPQLPSFNRGVWKQTEELIRSLLNSSDSLYIVTGPVLKPYLDKIGKNQVTVPSGYYNAVLRFKKGTISGIGFLIPHKRTLKKPKDFVVTIDSIENITGLDFFRFLDQKRQDDAESNYSFEVFLQH
jgi:endonuclease G, mitochondrial